MLDLRMKESLQERATGSLSTKLQKHQHGLPHSKNVHHAPSVQSYGIGTGAAKRAAACTATKFAGLTFSTLVSLTKQIAYLQ